MSQITKSIDESLDNNIDDTICPLCQNKNLCQAHQPEACWCNLTKVPQAVIDMVPPQLKRKSCICQACIEKYNFELATKAF